MTSALRRCHFICKLNTEPEQMNEKKKVTFKKIVNVSVISKQIWLSWLKAVNPALPLLAKESHDMESQVINGRAKEYIAYDYDFEIVAEIFI